MIIAIDGPSGSGKSTMAKKLAQQLKINYLDTGATFRATTYAIIKKDIDINDENSLVEFLENLKIDINKDQVFLNNEDVTQKIRTEEINSKLPLVASNKTVREYLLQIQRKIGAKGDWILDGRDIGTVVFPDAKIKFYLDASVEKRAKRRVAQNKILNIDEPYETIYASIQNRDKVDMSREIAPLKKADDAILINSDNLSIDEVLAEMLKIIKDKK